MTKGKVGRRIASAVRTTSLVSIGLAVLFLSAEPAVQQVATVPAIVIGLAAAAVGWLLPWSPIRRRVVNSLDHPSNDP